MAFTRHGHQILGSPAEPRPEGMGLVRCGGPGMCSQCSIESVNWQSAHGYTVEGGEAPYSNDLPQPVTVNVDETFLDKASRIVFDYIKPRLERTDTHVTFDRDEVYVVWFSKVLQNWKALLSTTLPDGMYYEVTYNGEKGETYLDAYKKFDNIKVVD